MSVRRRSPLSARAQRIARELKRCEAKVALLDRVRPLNLGAELLRLGAAFADGARPPAAFEHGPRPELGELRRALREAARTLAGGDVEEQLLATRAEELELEAQLAEHVGDRCFAALASQRFPFPEEGVSLRRLAETFLTAPAAPEPAGALHLSDDHQDPESLWSKISRRVASERWPVRVELAPGLVSLAAVADGVVRVRPGARLSVRVAERIALHEVEGHVRPRVSGTGLGGAFLAGTARASEDEEGRAILLEERAGLLGSERRRELARRYLAVLSLREGGELWDTVDVLGRTGAPAGAAIELACRVHRGGGLGRELVYLAGYARVASRFANEPRLEQVVRSGRLSLDAAVLLESSLDFDDDGDVI
ncbi:MAG: hypothetical protein K0R38_3608 [Polyangiaceae bacterium]|nr:hypothetical protein [Polyangiaceae bacterium]